MLLDFVVINNKYLFVSESPAEDFSRHRLIQPTLHHGRTKRELSSTRDTVSTILLLIILFIRLIWSVFTAEGTAAVKN